MKKSTIFFIKFTTYVLRPVQIFHLFISYSHADSAFVDKIEEKLNEKGIRFWRDVHHATAGRLEKQIDRAIRHNPTVLVILSENSIKSDWVEHEVRTARELEKETGRDVLCPVALDDSWKDSPWPKRVMEQVMEYNILDFSKWEDDTEFGKLFKKLIDGLGIVLQVKFSRTQLCQTKTAPEFQTQFLFTGCFLLSLTLFSRCSCFPILHFR